MKPLDPKQQEDLRVLRRRMRLGQISWARYSLELRRFYPEA